MQIDSLQTTQVCSRKDQPGSKLPAGERDWESDWP